MLKFSFNADGIKRLLFTGLFFVCIYLGSVEQVFAGKFYFSLIRFEDPLGAISSELIVEMESSTESSTLLHSNALDPKALIWLEGDERWRLTFDSEERLILSQLTTDPLSKIIRTLNSSSAVSKGDVSFQPVDEVTYLFTELAPKSISDSIQLQSQIKNFFSRLHLQRQRVSWPSLTEIQTNRAMGKIFFGSYLEMWLAKMCKAMFDLVQFRIRSSQMSPSVGEVFPGVILGIFSAATFVWGIREILFISPENNISEYWKIFKAYLKKRSERNLAKAVLLNQISVTGRAPFVPGHLSESLPILNSLTVRIEHLPSEVDLRNIFSNLREEISEKLRCKRFVLEDKNSN